MNDTLTSSDSQDSDSLARTPSTAEVDGWEVESSSVNQPTNSDLVERLQGPTAETTPTHPDAIDEDHDDAPDVPEPVEPQAQPKRKLTAAERKAVLQAEINAATRRKHEALRAAEEAEARAARAMRETVKPEPVKTESPAPDGEATEPDWDEYESRGEAFTKWAKDHAAWVERRTSTRAMEEARQAAREVAEQRIREEAERAAQSADAARYSARLANIEEKYPDFQEVVAANLADEAATPATPFIEEVVRKHPMGPELLYHLARHPSEAQVLAAFTQHGVPRPLYDAVRTSPDPVPLLSFLANHQDAYERFQRLDPPSQLLALGQLREQLRATGANTGSPVPARPVTAAKPPIRPLGATRSASTSQDPDELPFGPEYVARENARRAALARR